MKVISEFSEKFIVIRARKRDAPKGQSRVFSKLGHKEGKELVVEST